MSEAFQRHLSGLMSDPETRAGLRDRTGIDIDAFGQTRTGEQLRQWQRNAREQMLEVQSNSHSSIRTDCGRSNKKPATGRAWATSAVASPPSLLPGLPPLSLIVPVLAVLNELRATS
jgi:hypothetical protein